MRDKGATSAGCVRHTPILKANYLDAKAVILIGLPPHKNLPPEYDHYSWLMAVSRARQLLAIVKSGIGVRIFKVK